MSLEKEFEQFFKEANLNEAETEYFTEDIKNAIQGGFTSVRNYYTNTETQYCLVTYAKDEYKEIARNGLDKIWNILQKTRKTTEEDFEKDEFAVQVISRGSFVDSDSGDDKLYLIEVATFRLNPVALTEWLLSETMNSRGCYETEEKWRRHKGEYAEKRRACKGKILEALGMDPDTEHVNIVQALSEIFTMVHIEIMQESE